METGTPSTSASLPQDEPVVQTFNRVQNAFPSETSTLSVLVKADDVTSPAISDGVAQLEHAAAQHETLFPGENAVIEINPDKTVATVSLEIAGDGTTEPSYDALDMLRDELVPATVGSVEDTKVYVDGQTAQDRDFNDTMKSNIPYVFAFVLSAAFLLLLVTFRSIVVPIKAIVLNLLSVAASYGVMVLVFQHGWLKGLLGFSETGPITAWIPLFMFVVLFGLSMDYHVFILSRVREAYDKGMKTEDAVSYAIKNTAVGWLPKVKTEGECSPRPPRPHATPRCRIRCPPLVGPVVAVCEILRDHAVAPDARSKAACRSLDMWISLRNGPAASVARAR